MKKALLPAAAFLLSFPSCASSQPDGLAPRSGDQGGLAPRVPPPPATYYVSVTTGSDAASGRSPDQAFKTIGHAAAVVKPGEIVSVGPGSYSEVTTVEVAPGNVDAGAARTVFRADPPGGAILEGEHGADGKPKFERARFIIHRPNVTLDGFVVRDTNAWAVQYYKAPGGLVLHATLSNNTLDGISFFRGDGRVLDSLFLSGGRAAVSFDGSPSGAVIGCTFTHNQSGVAALDATGVVIFDDLFDQNVEALRVTGKGAQTIQSDHNLFHGGAIANWTAGDLTSASVGSLAEWQALSKQDVHSLSGDPVLTHDAASPDVVIPSAPPASTWSPAARAGLRVASFAGETAPELDMRGRAAGDGVAAAVGALFVPFGTPGKPVAVVDMPFDGRLTAALVDGAGQVVRDLVSDYPAPKGEQLLYWDGNDDGGKPLAPGRYSWKAVASQVHPVDDGSVGDSGNPPNGITNVPANVDGIAMDPAGNWYTVSFWDEAGLGIVKYDPQGKAVWNPTFYVRGSGFGQAVATDGKYVFVAIVKNVKNVPGGHLVQDEVRRLDAATGKPADYALPKAPATPPPADQRNVITVNPVKADPWRGSQNYTDEARRKLFGINGMACDDKRLWVSDGFQSKVEAFDKETGARLSSFAVDRPMGIAVAPGGNLWVAHSLNRVSEYTPGGKATGREVTGLSDPVAVAMGGPQHHLYTGEVGAGRLGEYAVDGGRPTLVRNFGHKAEGAGRVAPDVFWQGPSAIAVDAQGRMVIDDKISMRILRYAPDYSLIESRTTDQVMSPSVDERAPDVLVSDSRQYQVDYTTGRWDFTYEWAPGSGLRRTLPNGRDYLFQLGGTRVGVVVWAIEGDAAAPRMRKSAMVGGRWLGNDDLSPPSHAAEYAWQDSNADGQVQDAEVVWEKRADSTDHMMAHAPGWWVDSQGALWLCDQVSAAILKFPLLGFDAAGNPRYDWTKVTTVVSADKSDAKFRPNNMRVAPDGDLYVQGTTADTAKALGVFWMGGTAMARYAPDGTRRWVRRLPQAFVASAADGDYWYVGEGKSARVNMYTSDGLFLAEMTPGAPNAFTSGWIDQALGLTAFVHPRLKNHYVYAEEDLYGKAIRYRIDGLDTIKRFSGDVVVSH